MRTNLKKLLSVLLALVLIGGFSAVQAEGETHEAATELSKLSANSELPEGELNEWQTLRKEFLDNVDAMRDKYAPQVRTLANGVKVQRTPDDPDRMNNKFYKSDKRGCTACHTDLAQTLNSMTELSGVGAYWYAHHDFTNELGIELTYLQCLACHKNSIGSAQTYCLEMNTMMHAIHSADTAFGKIGGDCWSCHVVDELTGEFQLWDEVKFDMLHGIKKVSNVQGEFSYDQDVVTEDLFVLRHAYDWNLKTWAGLKPDPQTDGVYDQHTISVTGEVENPQTWTLRELIEKAPSVTDIGTWACEVNGFGGPLIESFEFTGIPVSWILEQGVPKEGANAFKNEMWGGPWTFEFNEDFPSYLVYEINGEPLDYQNGYPVLLYCMDGFAGGSIKAVKEIRVIHTENERYLYKKYHGGGGAYLFDKKATTHHPNVGLCEFTDGMIIPVGQPYTFEGYAHAYQYGIDAIEFSLDGGETWTRFDTTASQEGKWLYWYFTWTPEEVGAYTLSVRAWAEDGKTWDVHNEKLFNVQ